MKAQSMQSNKKIHNFNFRMMLAAAFFLGGFVFPIFFLLALLIGWSLIHDFRNPQQEIDAWFTRRWTTTANDPNWITYFLPLCESPAESAFLEAMIRAHGLVPNKGLLQGADLTLDLQVKIPPYRADFLVNRWLVVEIDGATYHSSPEAIERDKKRDEFMQDDGYSVLRIPASVVFATPNEAVDRVRAMLCRRHTPAHEVLSSKTESTKKGISLREVLSVVNNATGGINSFFTHQQQIEQCTRGLLERFHAERLVIEKAIELAESEIRVSQFISQSKEHRELYFAAYDELQGVLESKPQHNQTAGMANFREAFAIPPLPKNEVYPDQKLNDAINQARQAILSERESFFNSVRFKLDKDESLKELVKEKLNELRCGECWQYVSH